MTSMHERIRKDKENMDQKRFNLSQSPRYLVKTQLKNLKDKWAKLDNVELTVKEFLMNIYFLFGEQLVNFLGYRMNQEGGEENENNVNDNANNAEENAEENPAVAEVEEMALGVNQEMVANNGKNKNIIILSNLILNEIKITLSLFYL